MIRALTIAFLCCTLLACGGGGGSSGSSGTAGNTPPPSPQPPPTPTGADLATASQLLNLATFGPTYAEIESAAADGPSSWLDNQFASQISHHTPIVNRYINQYGLDFSADPSPGLFRRYAFWEQALTAPDQLRQLTAYALSQILVVSDNVDALFIDPRALSTYYDVLLEHSFGNYRDLLLAVTLNPSMGFYLSHVNNAKTDPAANTFPDENYAREVMQLFSIGLFQLNPDGSQQLDSQGRPIPTYDNQDIREFSKVFTGLSYAPRETGGSTQFGINSRVFDKPMIMFDEFHEPGEKRLLNGQVIPAGQSGMQDIEDAIDNLFNHPNVGPFIGRQLIQRLVTSNPSPAYVERVTNAFNGDGASPRGDMQAVIQAIVTDPEAAVGLRLREPFRRYVALVRSLESMGDDGSLPGAGFVAQFLVQQNVLSAPSVFNFYLPDFTPAGEIGSAGLVGPEFQITNASTISGMTNLVAYALYSEQSLDTAEGFTTIRADLTEFTDLTGDENALLDRIDMLFFGASMNPQSRTTISNAVVDLRNAGLPPIDLARVALYLSLISPDYAIQGAGT